MIWKTLGIGLSDEEREERERRKAEEIARRELERQLAEEAAYVADLIRRRLVELGICYRYKKADKRGFFQTEVRPIDFERVTATPEAHYLKVLTRSMPRGVSIVDLYKDDTVEALGYSIGTDVTYKAGKETGFWYVVPRKGRLGGIPRHVKYGDALNAIPQSAPTLAFPVGFGENNKFAWDDLESVTNLLIAGSKGGGKSNALNMILCSLIQRAGPDDLRLFLVDLKAGMEFVYYAGIPHLGGDVPYIDPNTGEEKAPPGYNNLQEDEYVRCEKVGMDMYPRRVPCSSCFHSRSIRRTGRSRPGRGNSLSCCYSGPPEGERVDGRRPDRRTGDTRSSRARCDAGRAPTPFRTGRSTDQGV